MVQDLVGVVSGTIISQTRVKINDRKNVIVLSQEITFFFTHYLLSI